MPRNLHSGGIRRQPHPDPLQDGDDRERQTGHDQAVFHRGRATLVGGETLNYLAHYSPTPPALLHAPPGPCPEGKVRQLLLLLR